VVSANNGVGSAVTSPTIVINPRSAVGGDQRNRTPTPSSSPGAPPPGAAARLAHVPASAASGHLASTGTSASPLIVWSAALILLGAVLVFLKRRSRRSAPGSDHE